jgi:hypothetical protein
MAGPGDSVPGCERTSFRERTSFMAAFTGPAPDPLTERDVMHSSCGRRSRGRRFRDLAAVAGAAVLVPAMLLAAGSPASAAARAGRPPHRGGAAGVTRGHASPGPDARPVMPRAAAAAMARARATGRPVVVAPDTTATSVTVADPDGTFKNTVSALPVRVRRGGTWVPVSARLVRGRGVLAPAAVAEPVTLSAGGAGPVAVLRRPDGQNLTLWFPGRLPVPVISGASATYRSVRPGIDLQVTVATTGGISQTLVVHTAAAASSSWLRRFTERYATSGGLRLAADAAGNLVARGRSGPVLEAGPPVVNLPPSAQHAARRGASGPGLPAAVGRAEVSGDRITDLFSGAVLAHPAAFPLSVVVAIGPAEGLASVAASSSGPANSAAAFPSPSTIKPYGYVEAQDVQGSGGCQGLTNWNSSSVTALGIGYQAWDTCEGVYQTYYVFDTSGIAAAWDILHMELNLTEVQGSWNACGGAAGVAQEPVYLHSLGANAGIGTGTDGSNVSTLGTSSLVDEVWPAANPNTTDNCANQPADFDVTSYGGSIKGNHYWTFGVNGNDTDNPDAGQFMRLSDNPTLVTTFDETPAAPAMEQSSPTMTDNPATTDTDYGCATSSDSDPVIPWIGAAGSVQLNASFTAPLSSENVEPGWKVSDASATLVNQTYANTSPGSFPYTIGSPTDGDEYHYQAWTTVNGNGGQDGYDPGETTDGPACAFATDQTPPTAPAVTSTAFPPAGSSPGTTQTAPGASGTFAFSASDPAPSGCSSSTPIAKASTGGTPATCLASGVYEFEYSLNQPLSSASVTPVTTLCPANGVTSGAVAAVNPTGNPATDTSANPSATSTATSCGISVSQWGTNILYVAAVDAAGNISQTYQYVFYVPWNATTTPIPGDLNGDGKPDLLATNSAGDLVFFPGGTDPAGGPLIASTPAYSPQGDNWSDYIVTHRGSWSGGNTDDLLALNTVGGNLYRYNNSWNTGAWATGGGTATSAMFEATQDIVTEYYPACSSIPSGEGGAGSSNCTGYPSAGWSAFSQIIAPGDAWTGAPTGSGVLDDTGQPSMLGVASNGSLWLFQGSGGQLTNPVQLGGSGWNDVTVMAAGDVDGTDTVWARVNTGTDAGDIESFPLTVPSGQVPTLDASAPATLPAATSGTILVNSSGSAIQVPSAIYPTVTATGALSNKACTSGASDTSGCPGFFAEDTSGDMFYFAGQPTTTPADALSGSSELVGNVTGTGQGSGIPSTGTVQNAAYPGDYCQLSNVQNNGGGWRINPANQMSGFYLEEGASFALGSQVECWFANGMHVKLVLQGTDGNLVYYQYYSPDTWAAGTNGKSTLNANFQTDGNFVVYNTSGASTWASNTHTYRNAVLVIQADGNLVIYQFLASTSPALWSTGTYVPALDGPMARA